MKKKKNFLTKLFGLGDLMRVWQYRKHEIKHENVPSRDKSWIICPCCGKTVFFTHTKNGSFQCDDCGSEYYYNIPIVTTKDVFLQFNEKQEEKAEERARREKAKANSDESVTKALAVICFGALVFGVIIFSSIFHDSNDRDTSLTKSQYEQMSVEDRMYYKDHFGEPKK